MRKQVAIASLLAIVLLFASAGGSSPALAESQPKVTGGFTFQSPPVWGIDLDLWFTVNIHELDPVTHEARGHCNWKIYHEEMGWRELKARIVSVDFGEYEGAPAAAFVAEITSKSGWGQGAPGEYAYFWVRDGGTPGRKGDQFGINYYSLDPFLEFWPDDDPPAGAYFDPFLPIDVEAGNLVIHK
jgi:hypothetical protein